MFRIRLLRETVFILVIEVCLQSLRSLSFYYLFHFLIQCFSLFIWVSYIFIIILMAAFSEWDEEQKILSESMPIRIGDILLQFMVWNRYYSDRKICRWYRTICKNMQKQYYLNSWLGRNHYRWNSVESRKFPKYLW